MISPNVVIVWNGTNASIPSGFSRVTDMDGKYPKGTANGTNPNDAGGTSTHTHTSTGHTHTINAHTHTYTLTNPTNPSIQGSAGGGNNGTLDGLHTHTGTSGTSSVTAATASTAVTYAAYSSEPPYYEVIFIKASGYQFVPDDGVIFWNSTAAAPTGFAHCNGTGTPDLRNKYLKGAAAGGNAGGTGGSTTNGHTIAHGHSNDNHTHVAANSNTRNTGGTCNLFGYNVTLMAQGHVHSITGDASAQAVTDYGGTVGDQSETVEPAYTKLNPIQNTSGNSLIPKSGMVAMWLGTLATIPTGWILCDGTNGTTDMRTKHLKCSNALSELANTGGSNTHTHAAQAHSHTGNGTHTHTLTGKEHVAEAGYDGSGADPHRATEIHGESVTAGTADFANSNTTADASNNEPTYRTVAYIQYKYNPFGAGAFFAGLLH